MHIVQAARQRQVLAYTQAAMDVSRELNLDHSSKMAGEARVHENCYDPWSVADFVAASAALIAIPGPTWP